MHTSWALSFWPSKSDRNATPPPTHSHAPTAKLRWCATQTHDSQTRFGFCPKRARAQAATQALEPAATEVGGEHQTLNARITATVQPPRFAMPAVRANRLPFVRLGPAPQSPKRVRVNLRISESVPAKRVRVGLMQIAAARTRFASRTGHVEYRMTLATSCVDDSDCLNGEQCDTETGTCGTIPSCAVGSGNAAAATCQCAPLNKVVAQGEMCACTADKDCSGQGQVCMSGGVCQVMDAQCPIGVAVTSPCRCSTNDNQELGTGAICKCAGDGDCVNGQNCNSADGTCGVLVQCPVGSGAGVASSCLCAPDNKVAAAGDDCACKKDADCSNVQQVCMSGGICQIPNMPCEIGAVVTTPCVCTTDGNRLAAVGSVCECSKSSDCMNGQECNTNHGTCGALPSCAVGAAAAVGSFCKCEPSDKILAVGDKCACEKDSDCSFDGQFCFSGGICKSPNTQCQTGALASAPCLCLTDNQSLGVGSICKCSVSSDCPSGKECREDGLCGDGSFPQCRPGKIVKSTCFCNIDNVATLLTSGKCKCASDSECTGKNQLCNSSGTCGKPRSCSVGLVAKDACYCNNSKSGGRKLIEKGAKCPCVQDEDCFSANKVCTTKGANRGLCKPAPTCVVGAKAKKSCWCKTNDDMTLNGDQCPCLDGSDCTGGRACSSGWCTISK
ncbi:hypothetical protein BJ741DRAFT_206410 [Chytriomyces cf. hyalinus JEL632]|nr:hypothetical protein BJ741DRAFT_206410 [Chytriomyces cf. hyalinus JEL632]